MATVKGTWRFNDVLNFPIGFALFAELSFCCDGEYYFLYDVSANGSLDYQDGYMNILTVYDDTMSGAKWVDEKYQTIDINGEQTVNDEFYEWFTANATRIDEEQTPIATITYKGETLETLNGGEYVTLHTKGKTMEDDIRVEVEDIPTPEDNYLPAEITTETQMDALPIGAVFRYVGETTDKYENGTLYLVEESE